MNEGEIDNYIQYLWTEYQSDTGDWNVLLTSLLNELREKMVVEFSKLLIHGLKEK